MIAGAEFTPKALGVAIAALIGSMFNGMVLASVAISILVGQIAADRGADMAAIAGAASFLFAGMAIGSLTLGRLIDRHGARAVQLPLTLCSGTLLGAISIAGGSLPLLYGAHLLLGIANPGAITYNKLLSTWFFRHRGLALTMVGIGVFIAQTLSPPIIRHFQSAFGWHDTYRLLALGELGVAFPLLLTLFRERDGSTTPASPASAAVTADGAPPLPLRQALAARAFWLLVGAQAPGLFAFLGVSAHAVGIMAGRNVPTDLAVWGLSIFALGGLIAQPLTGLLLDRFDTPKVLAPLSIASGASMLLLAVTAGAYPSLAALSLFGLCCGSQTSVASYMATRLFGVRNYSRVYGTLFPILLLLSAPAPAIVGMLVANGAGYRLPLAGLALAQALPLVLSFAFGRYPYPSRIDESARTTVPLVPRRLHGDAKDADGTT